MSESDCFSFITFEHVQCVIRLDLPICKRANFFPLGGSHVFRNALEFSQDVY